MNPPIKNPTIIIKGSIITSFIPLKPKMFLKKSSGILKIVAIIPNSLKVADIEQKKLVKLNPFTQYDVPKLIKDKIIDKISPIIPPIKAPFHLGFIRKSTSIFF